MSSAPTVPAIEIKLDDGSVAKGATWEEVAKNLAQMKVDTASALRTAREEITAKQDELTGLRSQEAERARAAAAEVERKRVEAARAAGTKVFDREKYVNLLNSTDPEDVARANDLWFEHRFGQKPEEVQQQFQYTGEKIAQYEQERVAGIFLAQHADYPAGDEKSAIALRKRTEGLLQSGFPYDARTLDTAYREAVAAGEIKPVEKKDDKNKTEDDRPNPTLTGAGAGGGGADDAATDEARLYALPMDQLEAELRRRGQLK